MLENVPYNLTQNPVPQKNLIYEFRIFHEVEETI